MLETYNAYMQLNILPLLSPGPNANENINQTREDWAKT